MTEASLPFTTERKSVSYSTSRPAPTNISMQFLGPKNDMERIIDQGLENLEFLKRFLKQTGMISVLEYAKERVKTCYKLSDNQKEEVLQIIAENPIIKEQQPKKRNHKKSINN